MSETKNLKLFKHDNPATNENLFDITKSLNENWDRIDDYIYKEETKRMENENERVQNENDRETAEINRNEAEQTRVSNENNRASAEEIRESNEDVRLNQENLRVEAEQGRAETEELRTQAEKEREIAETERESYITELKERVDSGEFIGNGIEKIELTSGNHAPGTMDTYTITYTDGTNKEIQVYNGKDGEGAGDMIKDVYDTDNDGVVDKAKHSETADNATNAETVSGHTVETNVPKEAVFTDTIYEEATINNAGLMSSKNKVKLDKIEPITYKTITLNANDWQQNEKTQYYEYIVEDETITKNHLVQCFLDVDEQEKVTGRASTKSENGKYTLILTEKPEEAITMDIVITKTGGDAE